MKKITLLLKAAVFFIAALQIQTSTAQTGVWTKTITWNGSSRKEVFNVPTNYTSSKKYKLIVGLHGLNGDPTYYISYFSFMCGSSASDAYPNQCTPPSFTYPAIFSPVYDNFIVVCPQATGTNADFWEPVADTGLITHAITDAMALYNIDPNYIYLNGESLGGRAALAYGLYNWWRFRGLILWVPAIQSMGEAQGGTMAQAGGSTFQFQNGQRIPINYMVAATDGLLYNDIEAYKELCHANALVNNQTLYPFCHNASPDEYTFNAIDFIDRNATSYMTNDAGIYNVLSPLTNICSGTFTPKVVIQNKGIGTLSSATVSYQIDGGTVNTVNWTGSLKQLERSNITLPAQTVAAGAHTFKVFTSMPNGASDNVPANDQQTINFSYVTNGTLATISEGFEDQTKKLTGIFQTDWRAPAGWRQAGTDSAFFWQLDTTEGSNGTTACMNFFNASQVDGLSAPDNAGVRSDLITPDYDFSAATAPVLKYDYSYCPILASSGNSILADSLMIKYSTDCGATWTKLLEKGGATLNTSTSPNSGAKSNGAFWDPSGPSDWKTETISLTSLIGKTNVEIAFENVCGKGNILYLDNISLTGATGVAEQQMPGVAFNVYPNPSNGKFTVDINTNEKYNYVLEVTNILGQTLYSEKISGQSGDYTKMVDMSKQNNGLYFVRLKSEQQEIVKKVIINK